MYDLMQHGLFIFYVVI